MKPEDELLTLQMRKRLQEAELSLIKLERYYKGNQLFYADQIQYVDELRARLSALR